MAGRGVYVCVCGGGGGRVSDFFHKESKSKKKNFFLVEGGGGVGVLGGVCGGLGGVDGWSDEQAQSNLPLQLLKLGHNNALMCKLCP